MISPPRLRGDVAEDRLAKINRRVKSSGKRLRTHKPTDTLEDERHPMRKKSTPDHLPSPVVGSSISPREFKRIAGTHPDGVVAPPMQEWQLQELNSDLHLMLLERMIDESIFDQQETDQDVIVDMDYSPITYEIFADEEEMPSELKHFIRSLEKLVQRTQRQLNLYNKKKTEN